MGVIVALVITLEAVVPGLLRGKVYTPLPVVQAVPHKALPVGCHCGGVINSTVEKYYHHLAVEMGVFIGYGRRTESPQRPLRSLLRRSYSDARQHIVRFVQSEGAILLETRHISRFSSWSGGG